VVVAEKIVKIWEWSPPFPCLKCENPSEEDMTMWYFFPLLRKQRSFDYRWGVEYCWRLSQFLVSISLFFEPIHVQNSQGSYAIKFMFISALSAVWKWVLFAASFQLFSYHVDLGCVFFNLF
jgi:hypothetical protein